MRPRTLILLALGVIALILACGGTLSFVVGPPSYYSAKYDEAPVALHPSPTPTTFTPQNQTEPHTCGFHSLSAIYKAYGLDPEAANLRFRLGTDMPTNLLAQNTTTGTIHPDILRVLDQDGFTTEVLLPGDSLGARLKEHLESGHPALILTKVSTWHWVVATSIKDEKVTICDSLRPELYEEPFDTYTADRVYNVILVNPTPRR